MHEEINTPLPSPLPPAFISPNPKPLTLGYQAPLFPLSRTVHSLPPPFRSRPSPPPSSSPFPCPSPPPYPKPSLSPNSQLTGTVFRLPLSRLCRSSLFLGATNLGAVCGKCYYCRNRRIRLRPSLFEVFPSRTSEANTHLVQEKCT